MTTIVCGSIGCSPKAHDVLSERERERNGASYVAGRLALKLAYNTEVHASNPLTTLETQTSGQPNIGNHYGSISHSGDVAIAAVSDKPIGVDVERVRSYRRDIERYIGSSHEWDLIMHHEHAAFVLWCAKESVLKAIGTGLDEPMRSLTLQSYKDGIVSVMDARGGRWHARIVETDAYVYAIAEHA